MSERAKDLLTETPRFHPCNSITRYEKARAELITKADKVLVYQMGFRNDSAAPYKP